MNILNILNNKELSDIPILYIFWIIYDLWFRGKGNIQKASWNTSKYNTTKYHLMSNGDLFLPYFLCKMCLQIYFYVLQYIYIKERR